MRILYLVPGQMPEQEQKRREQIAQTFVTNPNTEVQVEAVKEGPFSIESAIEDYMAVPEILKTLLKVQKMYDTAIIGCFGDPGLRPARELVKIPVIGPSEASVSFASIIGDTFSILTVLDSVVPLMEAQIREMGVASSCKSIRALNIPVLELAADEEKTLKVMINLAKQITHEDRPASIILGCMSEAFLLFDEKMQLSIDVPIINPAKVSIKIAEMLASLKMTHSKVSYPTPNLEKFYKAGLFQPPP